MYYRGQEKVIMGLPLLRVRYTIEEYLVMDNTCAKIDERPWASVVE
jgi:hypothetical protein